jgi:hypothetical protein
MAAPVGNAWTRRGAVVLACGGLIVILAKTWQPAGPPPQTGRIPHRDTSGEHRASMEPGTQEGHAPVLMRVARPVLKENEALRVPAGLLAQGWVVDALGGPVAGAAITARSAPGGEIEATALSGSDGRFLLGVASQSIELCAQHDGYSLECMYAAAPSEDNAFRLLPASSIVGRVVMEGTGAAVPGATVKATSLVRSHNPPRSSQTDDDGAFSITALPAGSYGLEATSPSARSREARVVVSIGETSEPVLLVSTPAVQLTGEVLVDDAPCKSGRVRMSGSVVVAAEEFNEGRVLLSGLLPGRYTTVVACEGGVTPLPTLIEVGAEPVRHVWNLDPVPRADPSVGDDVLDASLATLIVHLDVEGGAPDDLQVFANLRGLPSERARREGERFVFAPMPLGEYRVYAGDRLEESVSVHLDSVGETVTVELQLTAGASLSGVVLDEHDQPIADAWVSPTRTDAPLLYNPAPVLTDLDGRFSFVGAKDAYYRLTVSSPEGDAIVDGAKGDNVVVHVAQPGSVVGSVWTRERGLVPEFTIDLAPHHGSEHYEIRGGNSKFFVPALEPGDYDLRLRSPLGEAALKVVVAPGEELALDIELGSGLE